MIKVIIFDFDGVIVDSVALKHQAFFDLFAKEDLRTRQIAGQIIEKTRGRPRHQKFYEIFKALKKPPKQLKNLVKEYAQKYNDLVQDQIAKLGPVDGAIETFNILSRKYNLHINSGTPEPALKESVQTLQINHFFKGIHGLSLKNPQDPNFKGKNINKIAKLEKVKNSQMIFVGDAQIDFEASTAYGCHFVGIANEINQWKNREFPTISKLNELIGLTSNAKTFSKNKLNIFGPNNHSVYKIGWKKISKKLESQLRRLIIKWYCFDAQDEISEVDQWEVRSNNFRLKIKSSGKIQEVILRKHIRINDPQSILLIDKILNYLNKQKIKVPQVIKTKDGDDFFMHQNHYWQLYNFISGDHYRGTRQQLRDIAKQIAKLHRALAKIPLTKEIAQKININTPWEMTGWHKIFKISNLKNQKVGKLVNSHKDLILETANYIQGKSRDISHVKTQIIRGDLHPHDTLYEGERFKSFLDFEGVRIGELVRDVANALHRFVRQFVVYQNRPWRQTLPIGFKTFLKVYQSISPLTNREIRLIPFFIQDETLRKIFRILTRYYLQNNSASLKDGELEKQLTLLKEAEIISNVFEANQQGLYNS